MFAYLLITNASLFRFFFSRNRGPRFRLDSTRRNHSRPASSVLFRAIHANCSCGWKVGGPRPGSWNTLEPSRRSGRPASAHSKRTISTAGQHSSKGERNSVNSAESTAVELSPSHCGLCPALRPNSRRNYRRSRIFFVVQFLRTGNQRQSWKPMTETRW